MHTFAFDFETTSVDSLTAEFVCAAYQIDDNDVAITKDLSEIKQYLESDKYIKIAHNLKYEYACCKTWGIELKPPFFCTQIAVWVLNMGIPKVESNGEIWYDFKLKHLASPLLGEHGLPTFDELAKQYMVKAPTGKFLKSGKPKVKKRPATSNEIPFDVLAPYCKKDVYLTRKLYDLTNPLLLEKKLIDLFNLECGIIPVIASMERTGILVDKEYLTKYKAELEEEMKQIENEASVIAKTNINLSSHKQLRELIYNVFKLPVVIKTPEGVPSTSKSALYAVSNKTSHPIFDVIFKYRDLSKVYGTYVKRWLDKADDNDRVHFYIHQTGTVSGRSSSDSQQIPKRTEKAKLVRKAIIAPRGKMLCEVDYRTLEPRISAHLSQDKKLIELFNDGEDIYKATVAAALNKEIKDVSSEERNLGKVIVLANNYGQAQPLDEVVLTPTGWKCLGEVVVDDIVFTANGSKTKVTNVYPQGDKLCYKVSMTDGTSVITTSDHLWPIMDANARYHKGGCFFTVRKLSSIMGENLKYGTTQKYCIPKCSPIMFKKSKHLISPYLMGALLGDGCMSGGSIGFTCSKKHVLDRVNSSLPQGYCLRKRGDIEYDIVPEKPRGRDKRGCFYRDNLVINELIGMSLYGRHSYSKHIPKEYLLDSVENRRELLEGLLDTDGTKNHGSFEYITTSKTLANDIRFIVRSLGGRCSITTRTKKTLYINGLKVSNPRIQYRVFISFYYDKQFIKSIEPVGKKPCVCISVSDKSGLYITSDFIVTHNTGFGLAKKLGISEQEAQGYLDSYFNKYSGVKLWRMNTIAKAVKLGYTETILGRQSKVSADIALPSVWKRQHGKYYDVNMWRRAAAEREASNRPIQGSSQDIIKTAMIKIFPLLSEESKLIGMVHDSLIFEIPEDRIDKSIVALKRIMENALPLSVPTPVEVKVGKNLAEMREV